MNLAGIGAFIHTNAPHSGAALYFASVVFALLGLTAVSARCAYTKSIDRLPENWVVTVAAASAPVPTYCLLFILPFDSDLGQTLSHDPVVVMLAGLYGLAATFRDLRAMASRANRDKLAHPNKR